MTVYTISSNVETKSNPVHFLIKTTSNSEYCQQTWNFSPPISQVSWAPEYLVTSTRVLCGSEQQGSFNPSVSQSHNNSNMTIVTTLSVDLKTEKTSVLDKILLECSTASSIQPRQFTIRQHHRAALLPASGRIHCQFPSIDCVVPCSPQQHYPLGLNHYCLRTWTGRLNFTRIDRLVLPRSGRVCSFQSVLSTINLCSCARWSLEKRLHQH